MTEDAANALQAGYAYSRADSPPYCKFGAYWCLLSTSDTTQGRSTTFDELFPEGVVAPPHVSDKEAEAFFVLEGDLVFTLGDDDREIAAPPGAYVYNPQGTRHSFRCGSTVGRVYNTLVPGGGFDHGIVDHGTPAPQVLMPPPRTSARRSGSRSSMVVQRLPGRESSQWTCPRGDPPGSRLRLQAAASLPSHVPVKTVVRCR